MRRRSFLQTLVLAGCTHPSDAAPPEVIAFVGEDDVPKLGLVGQGLDGRLYYDLSLAPMGGAITTNDRFYVRTFMPDRLDTTKPWTVRVVDRDVGIDEILARARPLGVTLVECSGNARGGGFGLMSAAEWTGVPLLELLPPGPERVLVNGFDDHSQASAGGHSTAGASWIFSRADLEKTGAFLATGMNGAPLPDHHGRSVRLVVPGWYGCACIKWVDRVELVPDDAPATSQMKEFASRTHQAGVPELARDYAPAAIDLAAMPVLVRRVGDQLSIDGITWGGDVPAKELELSFGPNGPVDRIVLDASTREQRTWDFWLHTRPMLPNGRWTLTMRVVAPAVRTRRLDSGYYARTIEL